MLPLVINNICNMVNVHDIDLCLDQGLPGRKIIMNNFHVRARTIWKSEIAFGLIAVKNDFLLVPLPVKF